jgi:hypothetical protein
MAYQITYQNHIVQVHFTGRVTTQELVELDKEIFANWNDDDCIGHLYNYLDVEDVTFVHEDMRRIAVLDKTESFVIGPLKIAIVVTNEDVAQYSRLYVEGLEGSEWQASLCDTVEQGIAFITNS